MIPLTQDELASSIAGCLLDDEAGVLPDDRREMFRELLDQSMAFDKDEFKGKLLHEVAKQRYLRYGQEEKALFEGKESEETK